MASKFHVDHASDTAIHRKTKIRLSFEFIEDAFPGIENVENAVSHNEDVIELFLEKYKIKDGGLIESGWASTFRSWASDLK